MIARKKCKGDCGRYPVISLAGWCWQCVPEDIKEKVGTKRKLAQKNKNNRMAQSVKLRRLEKDINNVNNDLELWFLSHMNSSHKVCENCGVSLEHYSSTDWRGSQHHIIDKSPINGCPSVATNLFNHGVLGRWCCHPQWHTSHSNAEKMPIFQEFKRRFNLFKDKIIESEIRKIPECFYE